MPKEYVYVLLDTVSDTIMVDLKSSRTSTEGNDQLYPEVVLAMRLRFTGIESTVFDLADL